MAQLLLAVERRRAVLHQRVPGGSQFVKLLSRSRGRVDLPQLERRAHLASTHASIASVLAAWPSTCAKRRARIGCMRGIACMRESGSLAASDSSNARRQGPVDSYTTQPTREPIHAANASQTRARRW